MIFSIKQAFSDRNHFWASIALLAGTVPRTVRGRLGEASLSLNVQRSTFNAQRPTLERSNFRTLELPPRSGMTMIELIAALALFVIVLGSLLTILNSATTLWSSSRSQQREQAAAQSLIDLLTDDLQNAVTDSGVPSNTLAVAMPTFILDSRTNATANEVLIMLQFARHAIPHTQGTSPSGIPVSLDAVFYTFAGNALFRHVIPLSYATFDQAEPLGELLDKQRAKVKDKILLHDQILKALSDPTIKPSADWSYSVLATRIDVLGMLAALPEVYVRKTNFQKATEARQTADGLSLPPEYDYLETDVLPDRLDVALRLHNEEDWNTLQRLDGQSTDEADRKRQLLGLKFSKRITFPAQGGSRLP